MATKIDEATGEILEPQGEELSYSRAVLLLNAAAKHKESEKDAKQSYDLLLRTGDGRKAPGILRQWQLAHPDEELRDGETGVWLEKRMASTGRRVDWMNLVAKHPEAVLKLAELGMLSMNFAAWDAHPKDFLEADQFKGYIMPGGEALRLQVKTER